MLWIAALVSNMGTWMQDVGEAWLITSLSSSVLVVAVLSAADSLAIFMFSLPAGALADLFDRRRLAIGAQLWLMCISGLLSLLTYTHAIAAGSLIALTFLMGVGAALNSPVWQALIPEVVPRDELPAAVTLGGVSMNVARALGPAAGGLLVAASGPFTVFLLNAATFAYVATVLVAWRRQEVPRLEAPPERWLGALVAGLRYVRHSPPLIAAFSRSGASLFFGSALMGLLPLYARRSLGVDSKGYGFLIGSLGLGAVASARLLPLARRRVGPEALLSIGCGLFAFALVALAVSPGAWAGSLAMFVGGIGWMTMLSSLNVAVQQSSPSWVRGRVLSAYLLVFQGGVTVGALVWGALATRVGIPAAYLVAAAGLVSSTLLRSWFPLRAEAPDLTPSAHWAEPILASEPDPEEGPVLVLVEYRVPVEHQGDFTTAMARLADVRRRDGAFEWDLFRDPADVERLVETFLVGSWSEHLRQHERVTVADRELEEGLLALLAPGTRSVITHLIRAKRQG
jgi:MFS family permease